jgi:putative hydrolase of the HAD superfamily
MIELLAFDADDTLWINEPRYLAGERKLARALAPFLTAEEVKRELYETETGNIPIHGYGVKAYTLSLIETALRCSDGRVRPADLAELIDHGKEMMQGPVELFDGVESTLRILAERYPLALITKGDLFEQTVRIERSGLADFFRHVEVVGVKTEDSYRQLLARWGVDPAGFVMVGNSLRSDVLPVTALGGMGIHIPYALTWAHEDVRADEAAASNHGTVERIADVIEAVEALSRRASADRG